MDGTQPSWLPPSLRKVRIGHHRPPLTLLSTFPAFTTPQHHYPPPPHLGMVQTFPLGSSTFNTEVNAVNDWMLQSILKENELASEEIQICKNTISSVFGALSCQDDITWSITFSHPSFGFVCLKLINMLTVGGKKVYTQWWFSFFLPKISKV